jgi:hypothetical protein
VIHSEQASRLLTVWSLWGNQGMAKCWRKSYANENIDMPYKNVNQNKDLSIALLEPIERSLNQKTKRFVDTVPNNSYRF